MYATGAWLTFPPSAWDAHPLASPLEIGALHLTSWDAGETSVNALCPPMSYFTHTLLLCGRWMCIEVTLDTLESKGFHLRCLKKYLVKNNIRERQVIEAFLFCSPEQIEMARRILSGFLIQTDATFNTNELNMPLSILLSVTNTMSIFP